MIDGASGIGIRRPMRSLAIAASGLSAQRARLDVIAENIANAEVTRGVDGTPYRRKVVELRAAAGPGASGFPGIAGSTRIAGDPGMAGAFSSAQAQQHGGVEIVGISEDTSGGQLVYDPGHPDADGAGYVTMPNVSITDEMVDMMQTRRLFEANASVFQAIKSMLRSATQL